MFVSVSLTQLVKTIHNICMVRSLNPGHQKKRIRKICLMGRLIGFTCYANKLTYLLSNKNGGKM